MFFLALALARPRLRPAGESPPNETNRQASHSAPRRVRLRLGRPAGWPQRPGGTRSHKPGNRWPHRPGRERVAAHNATPTKACKLCPPGTRASPNKSDNKPRKRHSRHAHVIESPLGRRQQQHKQARKHTRFVSRADSVEALGRRRQIDSRRRRLVAGAPKRPPAGRKQSACCNCCNRALLLSSLLLRHDEWTVVERRARTSCAHHAPLCSHRSCKLTRLQCATRVLVAVAVAVAVSGVG
jgi:hypothetical protein